MNASEEVPSVKDVEKLMSLKENTVTKEKKISTEPKEKSAYKGVFKCGKKFKAQIQTNRVQHYLGLYDTEIEAARAYDNHARVVLGPRARTNFDYNSASPSTSGVLVAPIYTRGGDNSSGNSSAEGGDTTGPPKRTYVGIKLKRQIMPDGMTNSAGSGHPEEKRQKGVGAESNMYSLPGGFNGLYGYGAHNPSALSPDFFHTAALAAQQQQKQFGTSNSMNANSGMNSLSAAAVHATMSGLPGATAGGSSMDEQMRWFEQYQQMAFLQQQAFYMQQMQQQQQQQQYHGGASTGFNPYMMMGGTDAASPYSYMSGMPPSMGGVQSPYGYPYQASMMSMPGIGALNGYPSMTSGLMGGGAGGATGRAMDMSGLLLNKSAVNNTRNSATTDTASSTSSVLSAAAASLAAQMSLANTTTTTAATSAPARNDALGHLLTLSEAVSSLPTSQTVSPTAFQNGAHKNTQQSSSHRIPSSESTGNILDKAATATQQGTGAVSLDDPEDAAVAEEDEEEIDWRDQLYYWTGILTYDPMRRVHVWQGSWVGSYTGRPSALDFAESSNRFEYTTTTVRNTTKAGEVPPQSGPLQGFYMMDNIGDGTLEKYEDTEYEVLFEPICTPHGVTEQYAVYGRGDSEFGAFIVTGRYSAHSRVLEMTRQYVADTDLRARLTLQQLREHFRPASSSINK